jgi:MraZ protein
MFRGCFEHTIDDKGRLSIPAKFRDALETTFSAPLFVTFGDKCLVAYPADQWRLFEAKILEMPAYHPKAQAFRRAVYAPAQECPLDKAGRILVPPNLRTYAGLDREIVLSGMGKTFEIWSKDRYDVMLEAAMENFEEIAQAMGELGL